MKFWRKRDEFDGGFSLDRLIMAPFLWLGRLKRRWFREEELEVNDDRRGQTSVWQMIAFVPRLLFFMLIFLVTIWTASRRGRPFAWGLASFLVAALFFASLIVHNYFNLRIVNRYMRSTQVALTQSEPELAEGYARKACRLRYPNGFARVPADERTQLLLVAYCIKENDGLDQAIEFLENVFSDDDLGNLDAHLWIAEELSKVEALTDKQQESIGRHLSLAYRKSQDDFRVNQLYADYYLRNDEKEAAIQHLRRMFNQRPVILPLLAQTLKEVKREEEFQATIRNGLPTLSTLAIQHPNEYILWKALIECAVLRDDFRQAVLYVEDGFRHTNSTELKQMLGIEASMLMVRWYDKTFDWNNEQEFKLGVLKLTYALSILPTNGEAAQRLLDIYLAENFDDERMQWVLQTMDGDPHQFVTKIMLGIRALDREVDTGIEAARVYWTISETTTNRTGPLLSHLIVTLGRHHPDKVELAYQAIDVAISNAPSNLWYTEAKAIIHMDQKRWMEARQILVELLPKTERERETLRLLVTCCKELDLSEEAASYQSRLDRMRADQGAEPL